MRTFLQFLTESKQSIVNLGYPEIIAKILYKKFGRNAPLIAKWFRGYRFSREIPDNWWLQTTTSFNRDISLYDYTVLYKKVDNPEEYNKYLVDQLELRSRGDYDVKEEKAKLAKIIESLFMDDIFFKYGIIKDILNGDIKDLSPYKNLSMREAQNKKDHKKIFQETTPLKTYKNGYKWINVGKHCHLLGDLMRNCGSAGLMSWDEDKTMIALFDRNNNPHVVVVYSPNEHRISGDEGIASTEVKSKYHKYVIDLAEHLHAKFDTDKTKSAFLKMKYMLRNIGSNIRTLNSNSLYDKLFKFNIGNKEYYSNGYVAVSKDNVTKMVNAIKNKQVELMNYPKSDIAKALHYANQEILKHDLGFEYIPLSQFANQG